MTPTRLEVSILLVRAFVPWFFFFLYSHQSSSPLGDRTQVFSTTKEYFEYVVGQDCKQLIQQPNSAAGPYDAENKYTSFRVLASLVPGMINERYNCG